MLTRIAVQDYLHILLNITCSRRCTENREVDVPPHDSLRCEERHSADSSVLVDPRGIRPRHFTKGGLGLQGLGSGLKKAHPVSGTGSAAARRGRLPMHKTNLVRWTQCRGVLHGATLIKLCIILIYGHII